MRKLRELKIISYLFIVIMFLFIMLMVSELARVGGNLALDFRALGNVKFDHHLITGFSIIAYAYNVQFLVYPAYSELQDRTNQRFNKASAFSHTFEAVSYSLVGFIAILMFAPDVIKPDMLENMAKHTGVISVLIRLIFMLLLILDIPFIFYATKEQSLVMHDELVNRSISKITKQKIKMQKRSLMHEYSPSKKDRSAKATEKD